MDPNVLKGGGGHANSSGFGNPIGLAMGLMQHGALGMSRDGRSSLSTLSPDFSDEPFLRLNVGGTRFRLRTKTAYVRAPTGLLAELLRETHEERLVVS